MSYGIEVKNSAGSTLIDSGTDSYQIVEMGVVGHVFKTAFVYRFIYYDCQKTNNSLCFIRVDIWSFVFGIEYVVYRSLRSCWCINCLCRNLFLVFVVGGDLLRKAF